MFGDHLTPPDYLPLSYRERVGQSGRVVTRRPPKFVKKVHAAATCTHILKRSLSGVKGVGAAGEPALAVGSVVMSDDLKVELEQYLDAVNAEARALTEGLEREYDVARRLWRLGMEGMSEKTGKVAHPLWLIWGHLTDLVDGPGGARPRCGISSGSEDAEGC